MGASGPFAPSNASATDFGMPEILPNVPLPTADLLNSLGTAGDGASAGNFAHSSNSAGPALCSHCFCICYFSMHVHRHALLGNQYDLHGPLSLPSGFQQSIFTAFPLN